MKILVLDNYDSFTFNLIDYLQSAGAETLCIRNDEYSVKEILNFGYDAIVLSPGPSTPQSSGILMELIEHYPKQIPMLGVCLGFQALGIYFGAKLIKSPLPFHGKMSRIYLEHHDMFAGLGGRSDVCRYHSLCLTNLPDVLMQTARTEDGICMAFAHKTLPIWAYQFHPEAILTRQGKEMISLWLKQVEELCV